MIVEQTKKKMTTGREKERESKEEEERVFTMDRTQEEMTGNG